MSMANRGIFVTVGCTRSTRSQGRTLGLDATSLSLTSLLRQRKTIWYFEFPRRCSGSA